LSTPDRPLRADARRNRERVLAAAREAFAELGFGVPLDVIAERAGVGPGTVYRHFPTKEALFEAVTLARVRDLVAVARAGAQSADPGAALDGFLARLAHEASAKRDLPDALGGAGAAAVALARTELHAALDDLLNRARDAGAVRPGIGAPELLALLKGLLQAMQENTDPDLPARLVTVVRDGLRPPPSHI
jgi:AcrR family transcriptional regulator